MGCEIGQFSEWSEVRQLDWHLLDYEYHAKLQHYFAALNNLYLTTPALWDEIAEPREASFEWLEKHDADRSVIAFRRVSREGKDVTVVLNFTPMTHVNAHVNVPLPGKYREIFNSDKGEFGGSGVTNGGDMTAFPMEGSFLHKVCMNIPPLGCVILERVNENG
jgi:1,4-alpha-glucan branching enzyme